MENEKHFDPDYPVPPACIYCNSLYAYINHRDFHGETFFYVECVNCGVSTINYKTPEAACAKWQEGAYAKYIWSTPDFAYQSVIANCIKCAKHISSGDIFFIDEKKEYYICCLRCGTKVSAPTLHGAILAWNSRMALHPKTFICPFCGDIALFKDKFNVSEGAENIRKTECSIECVGCHAHTPQCFHSHDLMGKVDAHQNAESLWNSGFIFIDGCNLPYCALKQC